MLEVPTQDMCVWFPPATERPRVWAIVSGSGPSSTSFIPGTTCCPAQSPPPSAPGRAFSTLHGTPHCADSHQTPLLPLPGSVVVPYTGEHLRCTATASGKYCQKDLISSSHCLQNGFADLLTQVPLKAKHTFACRPTAHEASYQLLYLRQRTHYTKQFGFQGQCPGLGSHWCAETGKEGSQHCCHQESWKVYSFSIPPYACSVINVKLLELERNSTLKCLDERKRTLNRNFPFRYSLKTLEKVQIGVKNRDWHQKHSKALCDVD